MKRDPLHDFIEFLQALKNKKVKFVVVGAHAMSHWGYTRATGDIDVLISPDPTNTENLMAALKTFGTPIGRLTAEDFQKSGTVFQMGVPPIRIDILNSLDGVTTKQVFKTAASGRLLGISVKFIALAELIKNKKSTGREKDQLDVIELARIKK